MPPKRRSYRKGKTYGSRRGQQDRTRSDSLLSPSLKRLLIIDVEQASEDTAPSDIASSKTLYGGPNSKLRRAVCRRIVKLRKLKKEKEYEYW